MAERITYTGQLVFGLDIGTRSIIGTVGYKDKTGFNVVAMYAKEHDTRAMLDGQIHDISKVGETIKTVKEKLEEKIGRKLSEVCIAAAGRVLVTKNTTISYEFTEDTVINQEHILSLDLLGVEKAHNELMESGQSEEKFYHVGYTVVKYYLNDYPITNLENHKASKIAANIIATFLPEEVVDSLYRAIAIAGLEVSTMTLEPIAAINVAIPEKFRMLNIALVDVGAGTSDISITKDGSIIAYGMIPHAGDEITETIAKTLLVDFNKAEEIKTAVLKRKSVTYKDIMGTKNKVTNIEIYELVEPIIKKITKMIAEKIINLNGEKPVSAVFVVGGGGKFKGFTENMAKELNLANDRVALRGQEVLQEVNFLEEDIKKDSILVTPIGICLNFYDQKNNFIYVNFNGERIKLYNNNKLTIVDAAMQAGFKNEDLFPKRGKPLNFYVNGKPRVIRGEVGEAAVITLNEHTVGIQAPIEQNDKIWIIESTVGRDASFSVGELAEFQNSLTIYVNEQKIICPEFVEVNGKLESGYYTIRENDKIQMLNYYTVKQVLEFMDLDLDENEEIYVNNKLADEEEKVYENFSVNFKIKESYDIFTDEEEKESSDSKLEIIVNGKKEVLSDKKSYIFVDIFDIIAFDLKEIKGTEVVTTLNGKKADFMQPLKNGDIAEIYWKG